MDQDRLEKATGEEDGGAALSPQVHQGNVCARIAATQSPMFADNPAINRRVRNVER